MSHAQNHRVGAVLAIGVRYWSETPIEVAFTAGVYSPQPAVSEITEGILQVTSSDLLQLRNASARGEILEEAGVLCSASRGKSTRSLKYNHRKGEGR